MLNFIFFQPKHFFLFIPKQVSTLAWLGLLFIVPLFAQAQEGTLKIAVAANLLLPMEKVSALYQQEYNSRLMLIPGSSGKLSAQIINGAPYDVFISADMKYPEKIKRAGHTVTSPEALLRGGLVFWSNKPWEEPMSQWLTQQPIRSLAIAQPELAPYGQLAETWLKKQEIYDQVLPKMIFGESVGQVNQYIRSGTVEAAITARSAMHAEGLKNRGYWQPIALDEDGNATLDHGMVILANATADQYTIDQFIEFIKSPIAQKVFLDFGYTIP